MDSKNEKALDWAAIDTTYVTPRGATLKSEFMFPHQPSQTPTCETPAYWGELGVSTLGPTATNYKNLNKAQM